MLHSKDRKSTRDGWNIGNPIANRDCPQLTANHTSADCDENSLGPPMQYILLRVSHTGGYDALCIMNRMKHFLPFSALRLMYQLLVNCHLQFRLLAWGYEYNRVYNLQKKAVRIMIASKYNAHTEPLFKQLNIMKLEDSFSLQCLKFYHKFKGNYLPKPGLVLTITPAGTQNEPSVVLLFYSSNRNIIFLPCTIFTALIHASKSCAWNLWGTTGRAGANHNA